MGEGTCKAYYLNSSNKDRTIAHFLPPTMSAHDNLASLPPATLRAALEASEKRVRREKESIQKEIQRLQGRIHELEKGKDIPTPEMESPAVAKTNITSVSNGKRSRADSYDDDDEWVSEERWIRRPFASVRRTDPILPQRYVCGVWR